MMPHKFEGVVARDRVKSLHPELYFLVCEGDPDRPLDWVSERFEEPDRSWGERFAGASLMQANLSANFRWLIEQNLTGSAYNPTTNQSTVAKQFNLASTNLNNTAGGADECFSFQQPIVAGASATVNMNNSQNLLQQASIALARVKGFMFRQLSTTDDPTINSAINTASKVCVTNNGPTTPVQLNFGSGGSGLTLNITNAAAGAINTVSINTAGSGYLQNTTFLVTVNQANGAKAAISINTNAAGVPTAAVIANGGTSYIAGSGLPTTELGAFWLQTGNAQMLIDATAAGQTISNTYCNILVQNQDAANSVAPEIDFVGATT
jgi:hypothetical protein